MPDLNKILVCGLAATVLASPSALSAQSGVGFHFAFGWQDTAGDLGDVFDGGVDAEFSVTAPAGPLRVGIGANWVSFDITGVDGSFSQVQLHELAAYPIRISDKLQPYVQARVTHRRLRPEDQRYFGGEDAVLRDFVASGYGFEGVVGAQMFLSPRAAFDVSAALAPFSVSPDLSGEGLGPLDSGMSWRLHAGLSWFPVSDR